MSARRKRVISTNEIQFNHENAKMLLTEKKKGVNQNGQTPNIIGICPYCVQDRPVFEWNQVLLHPELTLWWSFLFANGAHHKKLHRPTHPLQNLSHLSCSPIWYSHLVQCTRASSSLYYSLMSILLYYSLISQQNGCHFADGILNACFGMMYIVFLFKIHAKLVLTSIQLRISQHWFR